MYPQNQLISISIFFLILIFILAISAKAYKVPHYTDYYRYEHEHFIAYRVRRWQMFKDNVLKRVKFFFNFFRPSAFAPFLYEQIVKSFSSLFGYYKKFHKLEENKGFIELLPTVIVKTTKWLIWTTIIIYITTYILLGHIWILKTKLNTYYNPAEAYIIINIYLLTIIGLSCPRLIGRFLVNKTIVYESPVRFSEPNEPNNIYKPDWNHYSLLKLEDPQHPGRPLTPEQLENLIKKYKSLDVVIDNHLIEMYGQYFIKGHYDQDLKNLYYNPQSFEKDSPFFDENKTKKYWHELELQLIDPKSIDKKDERVPHWIREPLENWYTGIQSVLGVIIFQLFQIWLQITMNYYNIFPAYEHSFWSLSWGWDAEDQFFYAPWLENQSFRDYLLNINIVY